MKKSYGRKGKRWFALFLCVCLIGTTTPITARAENGSTATGLCEHHTVHTTECGYEPSVEGHECEHVHTEDCYIQGKCQHHHTADCYTDGVLPADGEDKEADQCEHDCTAESGCLVLDCLHENGGHDDICKYEEASAGSPCPFVCDICGSEAEPEENNLSDASANVQEMMDVLSDAGDSALMSLEGFSATGQPIGATVKTINLNAAVLRPTESNDKKWNATNGNLVYFGTYGGNQVKYRVLASPNTQENSSNYLLLDSDTILWQGSDPSSMFDSISNNWSNSYIKRFLNGEKDTGYDYRSNGFLTGNFTDLEKNAIANTTLQQQNMYTAGYDLHEFYDNAATNQVFCLSAAEETDFIQMLTQEIRQAKITNGGCGRLFLIVMTLPASCTPAVTSTTLT